MSSSKTNAAAMVALAWLFGYPMVSRVFTLAPSYRQVDINLWGELPKLHERAKQRGTPLGGKMLQTTEYKLSKSWYALGFSVDNIEAVHGIHGENDLLIVDDAHGLPPALFDELENMMAGGNTHILLLYNPVALSGLTHEVNHSAAADWHNIKISFWDTPNAKGTRYIPGMLKPETVAYWGRKYGPTSNFYRIKVDADYPSQEAQSLISLEWIEAAFARQVTPGARASFGVDVARFGDDDSAIAPLFGRVCGQIDSWNGLDTMITAGRVKNCLTAAPPGSIAFVDVIGLGAGVVDRLAEQDIAVFGVNGSEEAEGIEPDGREAKDVYFNRRSQIFWLLRERLDPTHPAALALAKDPELQAELSAIRWKVHSDGRIRVESKEEMKKRLGWSPDRADALGNAVWGSERMDILTRGAEAVAEAAEAAQESNRGGNDAPVEGGDFLGGLI